jgi:GTP diphosphokinase / guanosine-3',5'-bis(diphosphate) 3'-diphosphatase
MQWNEFSFRIRHLSAADQKKVEHAFELGKEAHDGQKRQSGEPYFTHPIAVASMLVDMGADADTLCGHALRRASSRYG